MRFLTGFLDIPVIEVNIASGFTKLRHQKHRKKTFMIFSIPIIAEMSPLKWVLAIVLFTTIGGLAYFSLRKSEIKFLTSRIVATIPICIGIFYVINLGFNPLVPFLAAILGGIFAIIWTGPIITLVIKPFTDIFFPSEEIDEAPIYSSALRLRNQGLYSQALEKINLELEKFPEDPKGHILKSQILARDRKEPEEAIEQLESFLGNDPPPPKPAQVVILTQLAEISLEHLKNHDLAQTYFKEIIRKFPDSEASQSAEQRIAQIIIPSAKKAREPNKNFTVEKNDRDYGLEYGRDYVHDNLTKQMDDLPIEDLMAHLIEHPKNFAARKELVRRLAFEEDEPEDAIKWLQEALEIPHQSHRQRAGWYDMLVDIQIKKLANLDAAKMTLTRFIDEDPQSGMADLARKRILTLRRELDVLSQKDPIKLGEYEQDIGLKTKRKTS